MNVVVHNPKLENYQTLPLQQALQNDQLQFFHPLSTNIPEPTLAIEDALDLHNALLLADALHHYLVQDHSWSNTEMKLFLRRFFTNLYPPGA